MGAIRLLTLGPGTEAFWVRLYAHPAGDHRAAMIVADEVEPLGPDEVKGFGFFGETADEAERLAQVYLGMSKPVNLTEQSGATGKTPSERPGGFNARAQEWVLW